MDLVSILKDKGNVLGRFARKQLMVWLAVVGNPVAVISRLNLRSRRTVMPALRFVVFVYAMTVFVALPKMFLYQRVAVSNEVVILTDFVATAMGFCLVGLTLYAAGKIMGGRGRLLASMIAGFYLTAFWPIVQVTDYILSPDLPWLGSRATLMVRAVLLVIIGVLIVILIVAKATPVVAHIHHFGRVRATVAVLLQGFLVFVGLFVFLRPLFAKLAGRQ